MLHVSYMLLCFGLFPISAEGIRKIRTSEPLTSDKPETWKSENVTDVELIENCSKLNGLEVVKCKESYFKYKSFLQKKDANENEKNNIIKLDIHAYIPVNALVKNDRFRLTTILKLKNPQQGQNSTETEIQWGQNYTREINQTSQVKQDTAEKSSKIPEEEAAAKEKSAEEKTVNVAAEGGGAEKKRVNAAKEEENKSAIGETDSEKPSTAEMSTKENNPANKEASIGTTTQASESNVTEKNETAKSTEQETPSDSASSKTSSSVKNENNTSHGANIADTGTNHAKK